LSAILRSLARCCLALVHGRADGRWLRGTLLLLIAEPVLAGGSAPGLANEYSVYEEPEKPAISLILSEKRNLEEFRQEFNLSDEEVEEALASVRRENEALAREYAESERIVEANEGLPAGQVEKNIAASDYGEEVMAAVAETKTSIVAMLPKERKPELMAWVDAKFVQKISEDSSAVYRAAARSVRCKVFATQYHGYTRFEVALPHKFLKENYLDGNPFRVRLDRYQNAWVNVRYPWVRR
jgi:hypothetical protein